MKNVGANACKSLRILLFNLVLEYATRKVNESKVWHLSDFTYAYDNLIGDNTNKLQIM